MRKSVFRQRMARAVPPPVLALVALFLLSLHGAARAQPADSARAKREGEDITRPLPELPKVPSSRFEKPDKAHIQELEALLERASHRDALIRARAVREILEVRPALVDAIYHRLNRLADDADREAMRGRLRKIRSEARNVVRQKMRAEGKAGNVSTPDYLTMVAEYASPDSEAWKNLMALFTMSRMLVAIGNVRAARALIHIYVRFGEFVRVDTQLQLEKMGDRSLAALIEARRHPAEKIGKWAERQLDLLGKAIPSETVQTEDPEVLADVLRAYGRIRDPDAARIVISFANSEKAQIRLAARQGVALLGEVGNWQLRDTYENIVGKKPRRDWSWKRTARELFSEFDRLRLARVHELFDKGLAALKKRRFETASKAFDDVLANNPMFDRRNEMVDAYVEYAKSVPKAEVDRALLAARRAERINQDSKRESTLKSLTLTLQGERQLASGVAEQVLFRRALELDSDNQRARETLAMIERGESEPKRDHSRYYAALAIAGIAVFAILLILLRRPRILWSPRDREQTSDEPERSTDEKPPEIPGSSESTDENRGPPPPG